MRWLLRLRRTVFGSKAGNEFDEEADFHLDQRIDENLARGLPLEEAHREARQRLGARALAREQRRESDTLPWLRDVGQDLHYAFRGLWKTPVFALTSLAALATGIGANVAIFSVVNAVLLTPLPFPDPGRIMTLGYTFQGNRVPLASLTKFNVWQQQATTFQEIAAFRGPRAASLVAGADAAPILAMDVSARFFMLFGAQILEGRTFTVADDRPQGELVVVLSHGFWQRRFGGDPHVVGTHVVIDGRDAAIVGVLAPNFDVTSLAAAPDVLIPLRIDPNSTDQLPSLVAAGRLTPGVTVEAANAQARLVGNAFHRKFPDASGPDDTFFVEPFGAVMVANVRGSLLVLAGAVTLVLLIACANVANLLLIRASVRRREIAVRLAIGAGRWRIIRQLLTESLLLSLLGGALGVALGITGIRVLLAMGPPDIPRLGPQTSGVTADWHVLAFTVLVSLTAGLAFGLLPALYISRSDLSSALTDVSPRSGSGIRHLRTQSLIVVCQVGVALVLLVGAALLLRTFVALRTFDRGFDRHDVLTMRASRPPSPASTTSALAQLVRNGVERVGSLPGVASVAVTCCLPLEADWGTSFSIVGQPPAHPPGVIVVSYRIVTSQYFDVLKIPLIRGRRFTDRDDGSAPAVAMINAAMARRFWPRRDPLEDRLMVFPGLVPDEEPARQVVGIVGDVRDGMPMDAEQRPTIYVPLPQLLDRESRGWPLAWIIRTRLPPYILAPRVQEALRQLSGGLVITRVVSLDEWASQSSDPARFQTVALGSFAAAALLLAAVGVFGVMAYSVQQRSREIGIRLALGASRTQIRLLTLVQGMRLVLYGVTVGMLCAFGLTRMLNGLLFGVAEHDTAVFIAAPLLFCAVGLAAVWWPARRAALVDPMPWLRHE